MSDWALLRKLLPLVLLVLVFAGPPALAQPFELTVKKDRAFGSSQGTLVVGSQSVEYRTSDEKDARRWGYHDIKQIQILSPDRIAVRTYEDQSWIKFGVDRTFNFEVTEQPVPEELVAFLLDRVQHPLVVATVPPADSVPLFDVPVKLRRGGSHGTLEFLDSRLMYRTDEEDHSRVWRATDLYLVFQPDQHRLTVQAYEGGGDKRKAFEFDLKRPLPPGALEAIWKGMYGPSWPRVGARE